MNRKRMIQGVRMLLEGMDIDIRDPDFSGTPLRVAKLYEEMLTPNRTRKREVTFPSTYSGMVVLRHHKVFTFCPHHLLPVKLDVSIGYLPAKGMLGLSKLARIAESVLTRPMKQEEYTDKVAFVLHQQCEPKGIGVHVVGEHGCMQTRGVHTDGDVVTAVMRGQFLLNESTRSEFLELVRRT